MNQKLTMIAGVLAGVGASLCCVVPLFFVSIGFGGAGLANLAILEPLRPIFILLSLFCVGFAFYQLYLSPRECMPDKVCADIKTLTKQRVIYWMVTIPLLGLIAFPWLAPLFY